ncbi:hypothetical protein N825_26445 [Skermanella stibiiresistens SB22]|uniref:Uncharacterized protein n=1 Tax=Skermanella stibiiresistens SB22 TaxID=1385369 RepID=W9GS17_9PROT|nr:hypothetical protein [Skermanella stibiiresistens]EWY36579.1 hypothetical protein N825_26445 [Skermanella stibiiresistens SB22]
MSIDLVVIGENWGWPPSGTHHLVRHLGAGRKVVWVNSPTLTCCPACPHLKAYPAEANTYRPDRILAPLSLSTTFPADPNARAANQQLLGHQIRTAMAALDLRRPILLTSRPTAIDAVGELDEHAVVYHCDTNFGGHSSAGDVDRQCPLRQLETELIKRADLIITASPALAAKLPMSKTIMLAQAASPRDELDTASALWRTRAADVARLIGNLA